jgi:PAB1-binding protein PBP1
MAEVLRDGNELATPYYDGARSAAVRPSRAGALMDLGSVLLPWGLNSAVAPNNTHVNLTFGGPVSMFGPIMTDPASFSISPSLAIKSASVVGPSMVQLVTARQTQGVVYLVTVVGVRGP